MDGREAVSIGAVEGATGLTARQIRYYERWGLVEPGRSAGRHRQYTWDDVDRLKEIRRRLQAGQSLAAVRDALTARPAETAAPSPETTDAASHFRGQAWVRRHAGPARSGPSPVRRSLASNAPSDREEREE
ncbi:MAG: MerR family transcriptional regulator [Thermaerobacter sp.]|nr:MerR family transcriptional regulator [Thermaerobacter sp.]